MLVHKAHGTQLGMSCIFHCCFIPQTTTHVEPAYDHTTKRDFRQNAAGIFDKVIVCICTTKWVRNYRRSLIDQIKLNYFTLLCISVSEVEADSPKNIDCKSYLLHKQKHKKRNNDVSYVLFIIIRYNTFYLLLYNRVYF